jgi:transcriptional regulator with XRE-family HTH domain
MVSYSEALRRLGARARALRMVRELQQAEVAARAGVGIATVHRFEHSGRASIENVLRIASALGADAAFETLFEAPRYRSIDEALGRLEPPARKRIRKRT